MIQFISDNELHMHEKRLDKFIGEVMREALKRGIEANSVVINTNMVEVQKTWIDTVFGAREIPPMICGLYAYFTKDELPDGYSFAVLKGPDRSSRLEQFESIGMEPAELKKAAELYRSVLNQLL